MHRKLRLGPARSAPTAAGPLGGVPPAAAPADADRSPVRRFLLLLAVLVAAFYVLASTPFFRSRIATPLLQLDARMAARVLALLGVEVQARDRLIAASPDFALEVRRGCDALEPAVLFALGVLAAPAAAKAKAIGLVLGVALLVGLNTVRIVSLYVVGVRRPQLLEPLHAEWQVAFVLIAIAAWVAWAAWARDRWRGARDVAA